MARCHCAGSEFDFRVRRPLKPEHVYYAVEVLFAASTSFIAPVYVLFLIRRGLDYKGVALVDGFYMVSSALLDYPTGGLADKYGRGRIAALSCLFFGLGLLSYSFSRNLWMFLCSEFLAAVGAALYSGAFMAWLVDSLKAEGRGEELASILGSARILSLSVSVAGGFIGGFIAEHSLELPFAVGAISSFAAALFALLWTRGRGGVEEFRGGGYWEYLSRGARILIKSKPLILMTVGSILGSLGMPSFNLTWAPHMESMGANERLLGLASAVFMASMGVGSYMGGRLAERLGYRRAVILSLALMAASFLSLTSMFDPYTFIAAALPFKVGAGMINPH